MKFLIIIFFFLFSFHISYWYNLNDDKTIKTLEKKIYEISKKDNWLEEIKKLKEKIENLKLKNKSNIKNLEFLVKFDNILMYYINKEKEKELQNLKESLKEKRYSFISDFFDKHWKEISKYIDEKCFKKFELVDNIAKKNDFPIELILATWKKETWCNMINPNNWDWLFQIKSHYYKPWKISDKELEYQILEFIKYSHNKWIYFENNKKLKEKYNHKKIDIKYNFYTIKDLQIHAILYNWISKKYTLETSKYANWNINSNIKTDTDWIITLLLKSIKKELWK